MNWQNTSLASSQGMYTVRVTTTIASSATRCFDLARGVDAHIQSAGQTRERVVGGRTSGLLELGEEVTWEGCHFGITQRLTSRITAFRRPQFFQDRMVKGAFKFLEHDHHFEPREGGGTIMIDELRFQAPFGLLGWLMERLLLARHLRRFLCHRGLELKSIAESGERI
jgi:ligand-binding SRPBCC domain-containing protein